MLCPLRSSLTMPLNSPEYNLLIVSDLHLCEGRSERTHRLSRNEDFFFDEEFARFLDYHMHSDPGPKWHLIINGDFLDFLQVVSTEFDEEFLAYLGVQTAQEARELLGIGRQNTRFGFDAGPGETVFKLWRILNGHWLFTFALIRFLEAGNVVSIGRGNHDPEFVYDLVRHHFRKLLQWFYSRKLHVEGVTADQVAAFAEVCEKRVQFLDWFYYEPGVIWAEHGSQYDPINCFPHWLAPYLPNKDHIEVPWGSFFVRYLFNSIEHEEPWADNIKPQSRFVAWFLRRKPVLALRFLFGNGRFMLKKMAAAWKPAPRNNPREQEHEQRRIALTGEWNLPPETLADFDAQQAESVLRNPKGWWKVGKFFTRHWRLSLSVLVYLLVTVSLGGLLMLAQLLSPIVPGTVDHVVGWLFTARPLTKFFIEVLLVSRWFAFVYLVLAAVWAIRQRFPHDYSQCYLLPKADYVRSKLNVRFVTMGHTHDTDLSPVGINGEYFNTGTWTKVFSEEERLIREESELVFPQGIRGAHGITCKLMRWNDGANEPRLVKLFSDVGVPKKKPGTEKAE